MYHVKGQMAALALENGLPLLKVVLPNIFSRVNFLNMKSASFRDIGFSDFGWCEKFKACCFRFNGSKSNGCK